jgi:hypothetical protein
LRRSQVEENRVARLSALEALQARQQKAVEDVDELNTDLLRAHITRQTSLSRLDQR